MKMALGDRISCPLIARFKLKAAQLRLDCHHDRAPNWRIMTTHPICFDSAAESTKFQESINRSRYDAAARQPTRRVTLSHTRSETTGRKVRSRGLLAAH